MSAFSFLPTSPGGFSGTTTAVAVPAPPALPLTPIYRKSTTNADGSTDTFAFAIPIGSLIAWDVGGQIQDPALASVVAGNLVIAPAFTPLPGDPANPTFVRIGALYLR